MSAKPVFGSHFFAARKKNAVTQTVLSDGDQ
jgi:hypothetical protein